MKIDLPDDIIEKLYRAFTEARRVRQRELHAQIKPKFASILSAPPEHLNLTGPKPMVTRTKRILQDIRTTENLARMTEDQFLRIQHCGQKVMELVRAALVTQNLRFGMNDDEIALYLRGRFKLTE